MEQKDEDRKNLFERIYDKKDPQPSDQPSSFNLSEYIQTYRLEIGLICVCILSLFVIRYYTANKKVWDAARILTANVDSQMLDQFQEVYPDGYKVVVYAYKKFILTEFDTMPKNFFIDWKRLELVKISRDSVTIRIPQTSYALREIEVSEITHTFLRNMFSPTSLYDQNGISFEVQIINQEENRVLFLFGIFDQKKALQKKKQNKAEVTGTVPF